MLAKVTHYCYYNLTLPYKNGLSQLKFYSYLLLIVKVLTDTISDEQLLRKVETSEALTRLSICRHCGPFGYFKIRVQRVLLPDWLDVQVRLLLTTALAVGSLCSELARSAPRRTTNDIKETVSPKAVRSFNNDTIISYRLWNPPQVKLKMK